ncbi:bicyclomycin resistance protein, putative [Talaromyces stipitatus ATCC 10500]|uniref:Bicyclomycin resistance protein, putative n=1 Tax=Talaromyces stipitatus (strain ATCC 10500 / CBS 375.48 / QM 6759 / NRRL 1006) TaxID=441959 RepID=B8M0D7_TALSN|nr:bicyclomycin resistance protein, putative [Talaromyces stipitatus ATCC 10500]EED21234.1 bicyclomycin resistance protein, putative [Talaromyces stipitatus ATCC 10500]
MPSDDEIHSEAQLSELMQTVTRTSMLLELEATPSESGSETTTLRGSAVDSNENPDNNSNNVTHEAVHGNPSSYRFRRVASKTIVSFAPDDPENPHNWSTSKKIFVVISGMMQVLNSTIGSSLPSGAIKYIARDFNVTDETKLVLPISLFLVGYVLGPLLYGPLSEQYGRRYPLLIGYVLFDIFVMACALAPTFNALLVFRLFNGMAASAPIAIITGTFSDVFDNPTVRGRTMAWYMSCTAVGPIISPFMSGFISTVSWRWSFWLGLLIAGTSCPLVILYPETYGPVLLKSRARELRRKTGNMSIVAPMDLTPHDLRAVLTVTLTRPIRMIAKEYMVSLTCLYCALAYAIFYLYFQAYPLIFEGIYGMSTGIAGLIYLPIALGCFLACGIFIWYDGFLARAKARGTSWAQNEDYRRLPLACVGGPLYVISLFWLGWTASPNVHWAVPMCSGIIFGLAYELIFMAMLNYLSDAYQVFAASAQSASSCCRSILGAVLPLAAKPMFSAVGIDWGCSIIGFASLGVSVIPFGFIYFGERIRNGSKLMQHLKALREEEQRAWEAEQHGLQRVQQGTGDIEKGLQATVVSR